MTTSGKSPPARGGGPRKPTTPVKVDAGRSWGPIVLFGLVGLLAAGIIAWGLWAPFRPGAARYSWSERVGQIPGVADYRETSPADLTSNHAYGSQAYPQRPPVGGTHNPIWQQCMGNVYPAPIANEHAVHSLEHGAVWITYRTGLPPDQVAALAAKVTGKDYTLMSPVDDLDSPISLQAWGYQLKVDDATDPRIDDFITALRVNATMEPGATCSGGNTATGTTPLTEQQVEQLGG